MSSLVSAVESSFSMIGLTSPTSRFLVMAGIGGLGEYFVRPSYSYNDDGNPRPFLLLNPGDQGGTMLPPGSTALLVGALFALFI